MNIFVDSSFFIALLRRSDAHHKRAVRALKDAEQTPGIFYTSYPVIDETATVLSMRVSKKTAIAFLHATARDDFPVILAVDDAVRQEGFHLFEHTADKDVSMVDCFSAVLMHTHGISQCFTFDRQFKKLGFEALE